MSTTSLLLLPPEIRNAIWELVVPPCVLTLKPTPFELVPPQPPYYLCPNPNTNNQTSPSWHQVLGLITSCRQAYSEIYPLLFSRTTIQAPSLEHLHIFLHKIGSGKATMIHNFNLRVPIFYRGNNKVENIRSYSFKKNQQSSLAFIVG